MVNYPIIAQTFDFYTAFSYSANWNDYHSHMENMNMQMIRLDKLNGMVWKYAEYGEVPLGAVAAGTENGDTLYVGRASHRSSLTPGKVNPRRQACFIPWGGQEHKKHEYEVLCTAGEFLPCDNSTTLLLSPPAGMSEQGEPLYIGRARQKAHLICGKIQRSHNRVCYIPYRGKELNTTEYEVFVVNGKATDNASAVRDWNRKRKSA